MKGIVFTGNYIDVDKISHKMDFPSDTFPSMAFGSGTITKEDTYRYAKRLSSGLMRRIGWVGTVLKMDCKWQLLTASQFDILMKYITQTQFEVEFYWQGAIQRMMFYAGNVSATPFKLKETSSGKYGPVYYSDVSFNIISMDVIK